MDRELRYKGAFKINLKGKTNEEKYSILKYIIPLATNYHRGHYSISKIEKTYSLIGSNALNHFTCFSVSVDKRFEAHLDDCAFIQLPYESLGVEDIPTSIPKNELIEHLKNCLNQPIAQIGNIDYQKGYKQSISDLIDVVKLRWK